MLVREAAAVAVSGVIGLALALVMWRSDDGWQRVFREDFDTPVAVGGFPGPHYDARWDVYPDGWRDTSEKGIYQPSTVLSVSNGVLDYRLHSADGIPRGAAVVATLPGYGQLYGRYSIRFRADPVAGYGLACLLWPDSERWPADGEIDFPEGDLDGTISAYAHHADPKGGKDSFGTTARFGEWHVATTEWSPGRVRFLLDGRTIGTSTTDVPSAAMHWVCQAGTNGRTFPAKTDTGHIQIDWAVAWARD